MNKLLTILSFVLFSVSINAQSWVTDSVEMGAGYSHDVYYQLTTGSDNRVVADNWDIAFQMTTFGEPMFNATIRANHIKRDVQVYSLHKEASTSFGTLTAADTMVTLSNQLVNNDTSWGTGAFTNNRGSNQFDYGWGMYNMTSHNLEGDSLYLVKANGVFYQLWIKEYVSINNIGYTFRYAKWDGSGDKTDTIKRVAPYDNRMFAYYDLSSGTVIDREPARKDWDILFRQYQKNGQPGGQNPNKLQAYTGVLSNLRVEVAEITGVSPNSINTGNYTTHTSSLSLETNTIGDDWKVFNMTGNPPGYELDTNTSFIIKPDTAYNTTAYYHLRFTRFDGGSGGATGKVVFDKRVLYALSVDDAQGNTAAAYSIYPNPATYTVNIMLDAQQAQANTNMTLTDITGKVVINTTTSLKKGVNAYSFDVSALPPGTYIVVIANDTWKVSDKVIVQH